MTLVTVDSIRQRVYRKWMENPYLKPKQMCRELKLNYKVHGGYIRNLLSDFRCHIKVVLPEKAVVPTRRTFEWECVLFDEERGLGNGWIKSRSRDGRLIFYGDRGSVHWYKGGLVRLYLRGPVQVARAKELFCRAFSWFSDKQLCEYLDVPLREKLKKWYFELGVPVPRFDNRHFERSHGMRIFADGSHPTGYHVQETEPIWLSLFEREIAKHMQVIENYRVESEARAKEAEDARELIKALTERKKGWLRRLFEWLI